MDIWIEDDGRGFDAGTGLQQLGELVARLHYGMMGMQERAALVNAILSTEAAPCLGTQIRLEWKAMP